MHPVIEFFVVDAFGFYATVAALSLLMIGLIEYLHERFATVALIGLVVYLRYSGRFDIVRYGTDSPGGLAFWTLMFIAMGAACIWPAWYGFVSDAIEEHEERQGNLERFEAPYAEEHKGMLTAWVFLWPWKIAFFLIRHPVRKVKRAIFRAMEHQLNSMSLKMTNNARTRSRIRKNHV